MGGYSFNAGFLKSTEILLLHFLQDLQEYQSGPLLVHSDNVSARQKAYVRRHDQHRTNIYAFGVDYRKERGGCGVKLTTWRMAAVFWMVLIFIFSSIPSVFLGPAALPIDILKKVFHVIIFGILSVLYLLALKPGIPLSDFRYRTFFLSFFLTVLYALSDEYHQAFTPGRHSSLYDVIVDAGGAVVFLSSLYFIRNRKYIT